jgi:hypothetical protein
VSEKRASGAAASIASDGLAARTPGKSERKRLTLWWRWLSVALRGVHLVAVMWLGVALHSGGQPVPAIPLDASTTGLLVLATGLTMFALDLIKYPHHLREVAGLSVLAKLLLVALLLASDPLRLPLFWLIMTWSAVFSHAPASFRHYGLLRPRPLRLRDTP